MNKNKISEWLSKVWNDTYSDNWGVRIRSRLLFMSVWFMFMIMFLGILILSAVIVEYTKYN